jgi:hypothetical protein
MESQMSNQTFKLIAAGTFALVAMLSQPTTARAQDAVVEPVTAQVTTAPVTAAPAALDGPRMIQAGISHRALDAAAAPAPMKAGTNRDVAWMVVGGAALVVGSMIGGDGGTIIMITGGVIGLVGLMRFLQ